MWRCVRTRWARTIQWQIAHRAWHKRLLIFDLQSHLWRCDGLCLWTACIPGTHFQNHRTLWLVFDMSHKDFVFCFALLCFALLCFALLCFALFCFVLFFVFACMCYLFIFLVCLFRCFFFVLGICFFFNFIFVSTLFFLLYRAWRQWCLWWRTCAFYSGPPLLAFIPIPCLRDCILCTAY